MYEENAAPTPKKDNPLNVGASIDQVAAHIPLKVFRKQGLSEVRVVSEKTLNDLIANAVETELQKRFEDVSKERDELQRKAESLARQLEELREGTESFSGEKEELERQNAELEEQVARLRSKLDAQKVSVSRGIVGAPASMPRDEYEKRIKEVVENATEGARGMMPIDILEKVKESLLSQLIEKFPHTGGVSTPHRKETIPTATAAPTPPPPASGIGPVKTGSLFHKLVESNIKWREKEKAQEEKQE